MKSYVCLLITIFHRDWEASIKCALKIPREDISRDCIEYPMDADNKEFLSSLLPPNVREYGPIIDVEDIFEIEVK